MSDANEPGNVGRPLGRPRSDGGEPLGEPLGAQAGAPVVAGGPVEVTDRDEWLHPDAVHDEVVLEVDELQAPGVAPAGSGPLAPSVGFGSVPPPRAGLVLRVSLVVTPAGRHVHLTVAVDGVRARHDAEDLGPPPTNWDRMRLGGVEWRMVEPRQRWDLSVEDLDAGLRAYLTFTGTAPPTRTFEGYEQVGVVSGQVQLADVRTTVTGAPARRAHLWR